MSKRNGWKVVRKLTADEARAIRVRELKGAAAAHAEIGEAAHAVHYAERAERLRKA